MVGGRRLAGEHVEAGASQASGAQCRAERVLIDKAAARHVDEHGTGLEAGDARRVEEAHGLRLQREVQADDIAGAQEFIQFQHGEARVTRRPRPTADIHPQGLRHLPKTPADAPQADDPDTPAGEIEAEHALTRRPVRRRGRRGKLRYAPADGEQQGECMLRSALRERIRGIEHRDAGRSRGDEVDVLCAGADARHTAQGRTRAMQHPCGHAPGATGDDRTHAADVCVQSAAQGMVCGKQRLGLGMERFEQRHIGHRGDASPSQVRHGGGVWPPPAEAQAGGRPIAPEGGLRPTSRQGWRDIRRAPA